jgi:prepilin-type N-terminal cleavage/methylation domain-containing protein
VSLSKVQLDNHGSNIIKSKEGTIVKNKTSKLQGFTLIELIITISIIAILAAILVPTVTGYIEKANYTTDIANIRSLNSISQLYRLESNPIQEVIFSGLTTDAARMNALVSSHYLTSPIVPMQKDVFFTWKSNTQQWVMENAKIPSDLVGVVMGTAGQKGYLKGSYTGSVTDIVMPLTLNGVNITHVYQDVFNGKGLTSVYFDPATLVNQIHARAFNNNNLTEVTIPNTVTRLDYAAFNNNPITKITIGSNVAFETNVFRNNNVFRDIYMAQGAGTYLYKSGTWVKQ